jgi:hypothetical protein
MAAKRLTLSRVAGIIAWSTAAVAWGTAAVALSNQTSATETMPDTPQEPAPSAATVLEQLPAVPAMPESGLIVVRYTPTDRPEPNVVVRRVPGPTASSLVPTPTNAQPSAPIPAPAPVVEQSSGS